MMCETGLLSPPILAIEKLQCHEGLTEPTVALCATNYP